MTRITVSALLIALVAASAADADIRHVRTADQRLRALIREGIDTSPTFRVLVARLERSDVVVYVECSAVGRTRKRGGGRLTFVSSAGGFRYVVVEMGWLPSRAQQIAMLAHELQHAVEIADRPDIVDGPSLAREYQRMFDAIETQRRGATSFDTYAAVAAGEQVLIEVSSNRSDRSDRSERSTGD